jgi:multidrug efflux pump
MRLWLDPARMAAHQVTPLDVQRAVASQNVDLPSGRIEGADTELTLRTAGRLNTPEEFERLVIRQQNGRIIELKDVGSATLDAENLRGGMRRLGVPTSSTAGCNSSRRRSRRRSCSTSATTSRPSCAAR